MLTELTVGPTIFTPWSQPRPESPTPSSVGSLSDFSHFDPSLPYTLSEYYVKFQELPLEEWIHERFCSVYPVHAWAHDSLARALLFNVFMENSHIPTIDDVFAAVVSARGLRSRLIDAAPLIQELIVTEAMRSSWSDLGNPEELTWAAKVSPFPDMTSFGRCITVIFSDAMNQQWSDNPPLPSLSLALIDVMSFLTEPERVCPTSTDILRLPWISNAEALPNIPPAIDPLECSCGGCADIQTQWINGGAFGLTTKYQDIVRERASNGCDAIKQAWEPLLEAAEVWLEEIMEKVETPINLFPSTPEQRVGPAILDLLNLMGLKIGTPTAGPDILRMLTALRLSYEKEEAARGLLRPLQAGMLGYVCSYVTPEDRLEARFNTNFWISTTGGWLYDLASTSVAPNMPVMYFLYPSDSLQIICQRFNITASAAICMPSLISDPPLILPQQHGGPPHPVASEHESEDECSPLLIHLSNIYPHGYPLLTVLAEDAEVPRSSVAAKLSIEYRGRIFETLHRPSLVVGQKCSHKDRYHIARRCSLSSNDILLQVKHPFREVLKELAERMSDYQGLRGPPSQTLSMMNIEISRRTEHLHARGGPFEWGRLCIVRCGQSEGPIDPIVLLAGSLGKRLYVFHTSQCWDCASLKMVEHGCTVGIVTGTKLVTKCGLCEGFESRAKALMEENERDRGDRDWTKFPSS